MLAMLPPDDGRHVFPLVTARSVASETASHVEVTSLSTDSVLDLAEQSFDDSASLWPHATGHKGQGNDTSDAMEDAWLRMEEAAMQIAGQAQMERDRFLEERKALHEERLCFDWQRSLWEESVRRERADLEHLRADMDRELAELHRQRQEAESRAAVLDEREALQEAERVKRLLKRGRCKPSVQVSDSSPTACASKAPLRGMQPAPDASDLVGVNFSGELTLDVERSLFLQFKDSTLAVMFCGSYEELLDYDDDGNVFLDHPPAVMVHLIELLKAHRDGSPRRLAWACQIPEELSEAWRAMLKAFGLETVFAEFVASRFFP